MAMKMPEHMMPQIADLGEGEALIWAYAPQRSKPKNREWEQRIHAIIYALSLFWMGYMTHEFISKDSGFPTLLIVASIFAALGLGIGAFIKRKLKSKIKLGFRLYDHIIITDQRLKLGSLKRVEGGEITDFRAVPLSQIESAAMDYCQGSPCLAVHIKAESKPIYLIGAFDRDAALSALT